VRRFEGEFFNKLDYHPGSILASCLEFAPFEVER
jgi:hypothetical protein